MAFEKPRAGAKAILRRLWRYLYHYKWLLAAAVALSLTGNLLALAGPKLSGYAIDAIRPGRAEWTSTRFSTMQNGCLCFILPQRR